MLLFRLKMVSALETSWTTNNKPVKNYFIFWICDGVHLVIKKIPSKLILNTTTQDRPSTIENYSSANTTITWTHHFTIVKQQYCKLFGLRSKMVILKCTSFLHGHKAFFNSWQDSHHIILYECCDWMNSPWRHLQYYLHSDWSKTTAVVFRRRYDLYFSLRVWKLNENSQK